MIDEGYVKYESDWRQGPPPPPEIVAELNACRGPLIAAGMIGHDAEHDVGYGNLSARLGDSDRFVISGTQTGHIAATGGEHYALVTAVDIDGNRLCCVGPVQASSEAMTHAALYALSPAIRAVVHVHSRELWQRSRGILPTTGADVAYGTPAMAHEFERLWADGGLAERRVAVMGGHEDGLVAIGESAQAATESLLALAGAASRRKP